MRWPSRMRVWCRTAVCRSAPGGQVSVAHSLARRSRGRGRSRSRSGAGAVTRTAASAVRAVLADWMALSRPVISSRSASRSPSARIWAGCGRASSSRAARTASIGSLLPGPALADVLAAVDLGYLLALAGQVPGQAQPVMPGPFHGPHDLTLPGSRAGPGQQLPVSRRGSRHLQLGHGTAAGIADRRSMGVQVGVDPDDQVSVLAKAHGCLLHRCDAGRAAPAWRETPAAIL